MSGRGRNVWAGVAAVVVGLAVGFGIGAIAFGGGSSGTTTTTVSTKPIQLPASLGGLNDVSAVVASKRRGSVAKQTRANEAKVRAMTAAAYSHAFGGAAATYRRYSDSGLTRQVYVIAVRSGAPGLTIGPVVDPAYLGLATPEREVKTIGSVSCEIDWTPVVAGNKPQPSDEHVAVCERSGSTVTVFVGGSGFSGPTGLQSLAGLASQAWSVAGG